MLTGEQLLTESPGSLSHDDYTLLARIAHRYYVDDRTQEEIALEFALSRAKVQRLLKRARSAGIVDIHVQAPPWLNLDLERALRTALGLSDAVVSPSRPSPQSQRDAVARSAAQYLEQRLRDGAVVAVSHGRNTGAVPRFFRPGRRLDCTFVSAMGGSPRVDAPPNPNDICQMLAQAGGGRAESLYAPAYVESREIRDRLQEQEAIAHTLALAAQASVALVGIGGSDDNCTMVQSGCLSAQEIVRLRSQGAVGDVLGSYVDIEGRVIASPHLDRLVALSVDDLRGVETVVGVVSEPEKPAAVLGVVRAGVLDVLIVDEANARALLELAEACPAGGQREGDPGTHRANQRAPRATRAARSGVKERR